MHSIPTLEEQGYNVLFWHPNEPKWWVRCRVSRQLNNVLLFSGVAFAKGCRSSRRGNVLLLHGVATSDIFGYKYTCTEIYVKAVPVGAGAVFAISYDL